MTYIPQSRGRRAPRLPTPKTLLTLIPLIVCMIYKIPTKTPTDILPSGMIYTKQMKTATYINPLKYWHDIYNTNENIN